EMAWIPDEEGEGPGKYVYNFQPGETPGLEQIRKVHLALTRNMTFIEGNLFYRPWDSSLALFLADDTLRRQLKREGIPVLADVQPSNSDRFVPLNEGVTYGLLRVFDSDERPSILDVAIFRDLPNDVPLLRGIITESPQTPLSHVNLRAVQNRNPNAFIREASTHPEIEPLIGKYVRYSVQPDGFEITEATLEEVNAHLETLRPGGTQEPPRNLLWNRSIQALEDLGFQYSDSIGAKAANVAELILMAKGNQLPPEAVPPFGFAMPFFYYDEFMKHNNLYAAAEVMMASEGFAQDPEIRAKALKDFRRSIRDGATPEWMIEHLSRTQAAFAEVGGIRCRSSTNNEDLPGFNGAGLYGSYTHYPHEGHLSKSIKQVYASLWSFIAFEHREFYRVNHLKAAMGVLMHPNYKDEKANGVAVTHYDLVQVSSHPYYANVQVGENLVTNPESQSRPEELLLPVSAFSRGFNQMVPIRIGSSNQVPPGTQVLSDAQSLLLGTHLWAIHNHFLDLYREAFPLRYGRNDFDIEIEFKVTADHQLIIKQARPWVN
ncbi:MAG: PEP/pyruvate-binding domain-containing protein, partial [Verrucomicrobiota bacterium]